MVDRIVTYGSFLPILLWTGGLVSNFTSTYSGVNVHLAKCLNIVLNVKATVGVFNQEKALVGAFSVIVKSLRTFG